MFGVILKAANSSFQKCMTFCRSIHVKKVMKLLAFIFEQPSYSLFHVAYDKWGLMPHTPSIVFRLEHPAISNFSRNNLEANSP